MGFQYGGWFTLNALRWYFEEITIGHHFSFGTCKPIRDHERKEPIINRVSSLCARALSR